MTVDVLEALQQLPADVREELGAALARSEFLAESLADAELALEDRGWQRLGHNLDTQFTREGLGTAAKLARAMVVTNAIARRGMALRIAYIWGQGVQFTADDPDVNTLVQAFLDDDGNRRALTGEQAHEENERALGTDGNVFVCLPTSPLTGRVQARTIAFDEVVEVVKNPEDRDDPWFYLRRWEQTSLQSGDMGTGTVTQRMEAYYPALGFRPATRPRSINGKPVFWDKPVLHVSVNRLDGWDFGVGDLYTAMPWARAYSEFLRDWALLMKALAKLAWRTTTKGSKASQAAATIRARTAADAPAGQNVVGSPDVHLEAIPKSGATLDSESGRPLAAMVAAALDVPVTMLLGDPGVTGARATAETLDQPMRLAMGMRRTRWTEAFRRIFDHVIREAVRAPQGPLQGRVVRDGDGREVVVLAPVDGQDRDVTVETTWPPLDEVDVAALVKAIVEADSTGKVPPLVILKLLLRVLGVEDVDKILEDVQDDEGNWVDPVLSAATRREMDLGAGRRMAPQPEDQLLPDPTDGQEAPQ